MLVALSPYHLTTREPVAMAALLLAERVVTLLPRPIRGRREAENAAERVPRYLDLMLSWRWSQPLWEAGVICASLDGHEAAADVQEAHAQVVSEERFSRLRGLMRPDLLETEDSAPSSVAQKAEAALGSRVFAFVIPALLQASADRVLEARELMEPELAILRDALNEELGAPGATNGRPNRGSTRLVEAVGAYSDAFERNRELLTEPDDDEVRVIEGAISVTGIMLPADAVLTSSLAALEAMGSGRAELPIAPPSVPGSLDRPRFLALMVKALGRVAASQR
jgi:hypothetical protein